jgi:uncharacterized membrane protein YbhN (UPF0104 family)
VQSAAFRDQQTGVRLNRARIPGAGRKRWVRRAVRIVMVAGLAIAVPPLVRRMDVAALRTALVRASLVFLIGASALSMGSQWAKAFLWRVMLEAPPSVTTSRLLRYAAATASLSLVTPMRAGEALRPWLLRQNHGVPLGQSTGVALAEKLMDVLSLVVLVLPLPWLVPKLPHGIGRAVALLAAGGGAILGVSVLAARRLSPQGWIGRLFRGVRVFKETRTFLAALAVAVVVWGLDLGALWMSLRAVGIHEGYAGAAFVLLGVNAALLVPMTPGNFGTLEAGAVLALRLLGVPGPTGTAAALLYHAVQLVPLLGLAAVDAPTTLGIVRSARAAPMEA